MIVQISKKKLIPARWWCARARAHVCMSVGLFDPITGISPFFRACYTYSFNVRIHGRIGLNAPLFSRERRRTLVSCMSWRAFTVVLLFTGASIFARVAFFVPPSPDIQKCLSRAWQPSLRFIPRDAKYARGRMRGLLFISRLSPNSTGALKPRS